MIGSGAGISHNIATKAQDFSITYHGNYKVVRNVANGLAYVLHHCGTPSVFLDLPDDAVNAPVFEVPVKTWSSGLTVTYTFLEEMSLWDEAAMVDDTYMVAPCGRKLVTCGVIASPPTQDANYATHPDWISNASALSNVHFTNKPEYGTSSTGLTIDVAFDASFDPGSPHTTHTRTQKHYTTPTPTLITDTNLSHVRIRPRTHRWHHLPASC